MSKAVSHPKPSPPLKTKYKCNYNIIFFNFLSLIGQLIKFYGFEYLADRIIYENHPLISLEFLTSRKIIYI